MILIKTFNLLQVTMALQFGQWFTKITASPKLMGNIPNSNAKNKKFSSKYYLVFTPVFQVIWQDFVKIHQQEFKNGLIWGKKVTDSLLIDNFMRKPYLIILNEWKICSLFIKSTFVLLNRSLLMWSKTTQYALIMKEKIMKLLPYCMIFHQNLNLTILSHSMPS